MKSTVSKIELDPMAELLQTQRSGVTLPTFGALTCPSSYENPPKTPQNRTIQKIPIIFNMGHQAQDQIDHILGRVRSLDDLSIEDVTELRYISEHSLILDKLKVSPSEYREWLDKVGEDIRGVEYDAQNACIVLKGGPSWMHEATIGIIYELLLPLRDRMSAATRSNYTLMGSKSEYNLEPIYCLSVRRTNLALGCKLVGKFNHSSKEADASIKKSRDKWPVVVLEVGISETTTKLYKDAERWLKGSCGQTKLVILVDIQEKGRRNTSNDKWELSEIDFQQSNYVTISNKILQWYQSREIRLVGSFELSVHLLYSDGDSQCILEKAAFSPNNLIDLTTIQDIPLRLDYLVPDGSDLCQPLLFPLRRLVHTLQNDFEDIESDRVDDLAENELKKHFSS